MVFVVASKGTSSISTLCPNESLISSQSRRKWDKFDLLTKDEVKVSVTLNALRFVAAEEGLIEFR